MQPDGIVSTSLCQPVDELDAITAVGIVISQIVITVDDFNGAEPLIFFDQPLRLIDTVTEDISFRCFPDVIQPDLHCFCSRSKISMVASMESTTLVM